MSLLVAEVMIITEQTAEQDLIRILSNISDALREPKIAKRIYLSIKEQVLSHDHIPYRYAVVSEEPYTQMGVQKIPVENYTAFYFVDDKQDRSCFQNFCLTAGNGKI